MPTALPLAFLDTLGSSELMIIFLVILVLFGGKKMPELARGLGKSIREFKKAASGVEQELKRVLEEEPPATSSRATTYVDESAAAGTILPPRVADAQPGSSHPYDSPTPTPASGTVPANVATPASGPAPTAPAVQPAPSAAEATRDEPETPPTGPSPHAG